MTSAFDKPSYAIRHVKSVREAKAIREKDGMAYITIAAWYLTTHAGIAYGLTGEGEALAEQAWIISDVRADVERCEQLFRGENLTETEARRAFRKTADDKWNTSPLTADEVALWSRTVRQQRQWLDAASHGVTVCVCDGAGVSVIGGWHLPRDPAAVA